VGGGEEATLWCIDSTVVCVRVMGAYVRARVCACACVCAYVAGAAEAKKHLVALE
jgi:hypothetical protein